MEMVPPPPLSGTVSMSSGCPLHRQRPAVSPRLDDHTPSRRRTEHTRTTCQQPMIRYSPSPSTVTNLNMSCSSSGVDACSTRPNVADGDVRHKSSTERRNVPFEHLNRSGSSPVLKVTIPSSASTTLTVHWRQRTVSGLTTATLRAHVRFWYERKQSVVDNWKE